MLQLDLMKKNWRNYSNMVYWSCKQTSDIAYFLMLLLGINKGCLGLLIFLNVEKRKLIGFVMKCNAIKILQNFRDEYPGKNVDRQECIKSSLNIRSLNKQWKEIEFTTDANDSM